MTDTILEALNKLVEKSGGDPSDNKLIVDAINDLVETGGGSRGGITLVETVQFIPSTATTVASDGIVSVNKWSLLTYNDTAISSLSDIGKYDFAVVDAIDPSMSISTSSTPGWALLGYSWKYKKLTITAKNISGSNKQTSGAWARISFYKVG